MTTVFKRFRRGIKLIVESHVKRVFKDRFYTSVIECNEGKFFKQTVTINDDF